MRKAPFIIALTFVFCTILSSCEFEGKSATIRIHNDSDYILTDVRASEFIFEKSLKPGWGIESFCHWQDSNDYLDIIFSFSREGKDGFELQRSKRIYDGETIILRITNDDEEFE